MADNDNEMDQNMQDGLVLCTDQDVKITSFPSSKEVDGFEIIPEFSTKVTICEDESVQTESCTPGKDNPEGEVDTDKCKLKDSNNSEVSTGPENVSSKKKDDDCNSNPKCHTEYRAQRTNYGNSGTEQDQSMSRPELKYKCNCGEFFEKSSELAAHKRWNCKAVENKMQCNICKSWFAHEAGLKRHMKHLHTWDYKCTHCPLRFPNCIKLSRHWMDFHYDENGECNRLKCFLCGSESFQDKFELEAHLLRHKYNKLKSERDMAMSHHVNKSSKPVSIDLTSDECVTQPLSHSPRQLQSDKTHPPPNDSQWFRRCHHAPHRPSHNHPLPPSISLPPFAHPGLLTPPFHCLSHPGTSSSHDPSKTGSNDVQFPYMKQHWKHQNRGKWKRYLKSVMGQYMPNWSVRFSPISLPAQSHYRSESDTGPPMFSSSTSSVATTSATANSEKTEDLSGFKMTCTFCGQVMEKGKTAQQHFQECPMQPMFKCCGCERTFKRHDRLIRHMNRHGHFPGRSGQSSASSSSISNLQERLDSVLDFQTNHMPRTSQKGDNSSSINKEDCGKLSESLENHDERSQNMNDDSSSRIFEVLNKSIKEKQSPTLDSDSKCRKPVTVVSGDDSQMEESSLVIDEEHDPSKTSYPFVCTVCKAVLAKPTILSAHLQEHVTHVISVQKVYEWKRKSSHYLSFDCNEGSSIFSCTDSVTDAASISTATDSSFLETRSRRSTNQSLFSRHEKSSSRSSIVSESEKWHQPRCEKKQRKEVFPCEFCEEKFAFRKGLRFHMKEKHNDKRNDLQCPVCQKKFCWNGRAQFYERHLSSHYGVKIFKHKCDICDKTFLEKGKLQAHMARHKAELLHKCHLCGKGYGTKSSLTRHLRQHSGDKPHQCSLCSESFLEKRELIRHAAVHTGTPAFACVVCGQGFTLKTSLDTHMKRKHQQSSL